MIRYITGIATASIFILDMPAPLFNPFRPVFWLMLIVVLILAFIGSFGGMVIDEKIKRTKWRGTGKKKVLKY